MTFVLGRAGDINILNFALKSLHIYRPLSLQTKLIRIEFSMVEIRWSHDNVIINVDL